MQLIACWYHNIGPFLDRPVGLHFLHGAYLIKANIGSGKSFLFFDGPMFGLYKYSRRPMLHRQAKEGQVQVLFEHLGQTYLICRTITMTKAGGDSVITRLYRIQNAKFKMQDDLYSEVLNRNVESLEFLLKTESEEIPFKSGVELEATLASLLPPQEVIESSSILLQESDNIFEMTPGERINIFKHLFGLLGIDEAKEILADRKKQIIAQRELLADTSQINTQFHSLIVGFLFALEQWNTQAKILGYETFSGTVIDDLMLTKDTLQIEDFQWKAEDIETVFLKQKIQQDRDIFVGLQTSQQQQKVRFQQLQLQIQEGEQKKLLLSQQYEQVKLQISRIDVSQITALQEQKHQLLLWAEQLLGKYDYRSYSSFGLQGSSLLQVAGEIQSKIQEAELLKTKIAQQEREKEQFTQQNQELQSQQERLQSQKSELDIAVKKGSVYICENCYHENCIPGTENAIATKQLVHVNQELQRILHQKEDIQRKIQNIPGMTQETQALEKIKTMFLNIPWKALREDALQFQTFQEQIQGIDRQLMQFQQQQQQLQQLQQDVIRLQTQGEEMEKQLGIKKDELSVFESEKEDNETKDYQSEIQKREQLAKILDQIDQSNSRIGELVTMSREQLVKVKQLKEQEHIVSDLFTIYSKELMLVVLQDFLPSLELAINTNLAQVVDYEIKFELIKKTGDKLELEIFVIDEKGQRQVKSLSGGQKTVLKLVWILSVATMMKSEFLFMDETINNLDTDAIAKVAELIKNFVTYHDMKYYVVTHATQIQEMGIWTKTIQISDERIEN